jgi:hypothetical protein
MGGMGAGGWAAGMGGLVGAALLDDEMGDGDTDEDDMELEMGGWRHVDVEPSYSGPRPEQPHALDRPFVLQMLEHFRCEPLPLTVKKVAKSEIRVWHGATEKGP